VVLRVVDGVDTNSVDAERLEVGNIALQALDIEQRVLCIGGTTWRISVQDGLVSGVTLSRTWLVSNTTDVESVVACEEGIALNGHGRELSLGLASDDICVGGVDRCAEKGEDSERLHDCDGKKEEAIKRIIEERNNWCLTSDW
jgi:hypothetical protein